MKRLANPSQNQLLALGILVFSAGAIFSPPLQVFAQPPQSTFGESAEQIAGTPQPLATPVADDSASSRNTRAIGTITGQGTVGSIAKFTGANAIGNSVLFENGGKVGIGTTTPSGLLSVKGTSTNVYPIYGLGVGNAILGSSTGGVGVYGIHSNTSGVQSGVLGESSSTSANAAGAVGTILSTAPGVNSAGVRGINRSTSANGFGVYGSQGGSGAGVYGSSPKGTGVFGDSTGGTGVSGHSAESNGVYGESKNGTGVSARSQKRFGVYAFSSDSVGVYAESVNGNGLYAHSINANSIYSSSDSHIAVEAASPHGTGVYGYSTDGNGISGASGSGAGVVGSSSTSYGVHGASPYGTAIFGESSEGVAGSFVGKVVVTGDLQVTGTFSQGATSFKIDHPQHPATEYLSHSFVESPDMMNVYNGNVTTDARGHAWVKLPSYFSALNRDFRYQLTPIGQFAQAIVGEEIKGNRFLIRTDKPNVKVSWQVTGIRNDAYARQHRIKVEETKTGADRGKYLYPAGFGAEQDKQIGAQLSRLAQRPGNATG